MCRLGAGHRRLPAGRRLSLGGRQDPAPPAPRATRRRRRRGSRQAGSAASCWSWPSPCTTSPRGWPWAWPLARWRPGFRAATLGRGHRPGHGHRHPELSRGRGRLGAPAPRGHVPSKGLLVRPASGMVEPIAGVIGAAAVLLMRPILPYALAFAAGAMIYVVVEELIPESQLETHQRRGHHRRHAGLCGHDDPGCGAGLRTLSSSGWCLPNGGGLGGAGT